MLMNPKNRIETIRRDPRWAAVIARDPAADGRFVYAVRSTGIYCRPVCPARRPSPENVAFYSGPREAEAAGFRACRRCDPARPGRHLGHAERIAAACRMLETAEEPPRLDDLARQAGLSPHHFHRLFRAETGLTPRAYGAAARAGRMRAALAEPETTITDAIYTAGYSAPSRFYDSAKGRLGMTPTRLRNGGANESLRFAIGASSLGAVLVAASPAGIAAILIGDDPALLAEDLQRRFPAADLVSGDEDFGRMVAAVIALVEAPEKGLDLPLDIRGTAFQERVWRALMKIGPGETVSYAELARRLEMPGATRAVASACAANALAVVVPCHRVVRSDGALSGYRWGVERKRELLERERARAGKD